MKKNTHSSIYLSVYKKRRYIDFERKLNEMYILHFFRLFQKLLRINEKVVMKKR